MDKSGIIQSCFIAEEKRGQGEKGLYLHYIRELCGRAAEVEGILFTNMTVKKMTLMLQNPALRIEQCQTHVVTAVKFKRTPQVENSTS